MCLRRRLVAFLCVSRPVALPRLSRLLKEGYWGCVGRIEPNFLAAYGISRHPASPFAVEQSVWARRSSTLPIQKAARTSSFEPREWRNKEAHVGTHQVLGSLSLTAQVEFKHLLTRLQEAVVRRLDPAASSSRQDQREKSDDEGWEVVAKPGNEQKSHGTGFSSSFDLQLGWGSWRTSVLSWDVNVRRGHTHLPSNSQASGNTAHEPKTEGKGTQSNSGGQ